GGSGRAVLDLPHAPFLVPLGKIGMGKVIAFVQKRDAQGLGAGICEAVAEIEIGPMADSLAIGSACVEREASDRWRDGHLFRGDVLNEGVDSLLGPSQKRRRRLH